MKELISIGTCTIDNQVVQTVNARDVYQFLGARKDFSSWIKRQIERVKLKEGIDFLKVTQKGELSTTGQNTIEYYLTIDAGKNVALMSGTDRGQEVRTYFIACEKIAMKVITLPDFNNPIIAARAWADEVEQKQLLQTKIEEQAPKVEFANQVEESVNAIPIGNFAKILNKHGLSIGQKRLFAFLRDRNILMGDNTPYQAHLNRGWFEVKELVIQTANGVFTRAKTLVTGRGQLAITRLVMAYYGNGNPKATYLPGLEVRA